jgi:flagellar biosynthetic protein FlhB
MADKSGKTEQPTQRKLVKAREEGQFASAKEFVSALQFLVFLGLLSAGGAHWFAQFRQTTRSLLRLAFARELRPEDLLHVAYQVAQQNILPIVLASLGVAAATLAFRLVTTGFGLSLKKLAPDAARFNPIARLQEIPRNNLPNMAQATVLIPVFCGPSTWWRATNWKRWWRCRYRAWRAG